VRRLEMGVAVAEVARAAEVSPNALYRWRGESCMSSAAKRLRGRAEAGRKNSKWRRWNAR